MRCNQCGKCTSGCPSASITDMNPRRIMAAAQLGMAEIILDEGVEWHCAQCHLCSERCPRDVDPALIIISLQNMAVRGEFQYPRALAMILEAVGETGFIQMPREVVGRDFEVYERESLGLPELRPIGDESFKRALKEAEALELPPMRIEKALKAVEAERGLALYLGCTIPTEQYAYELSSKESLKALGVDVVDVDGFSCCGYPLRSYSLTLWLYLSARNLAVAEGEELDLLPLCNGCYLSLREAKALLDSYGSLREAVDRLLGVEGLEYRGGVEVHHLLDILSRKVEAGGVRLRLAAHYGCHAIRPSSLGREDPEEPRTLDRLIERLGALSVEYPEKLDCCGASLILSQPEAAYKIAGAKLQSLRRLKVDALIDVCPFCHRMYDAGQDAIRNLMGVEISLPVLYYTQLLGLSFGISGERLGLNLNLSPIDELLERIEI